MYKIVAMGLLVVLLTLMWVVPTLLMVLPPWNTQNGSFPDWVDTPFFQAQKVLGYYRAFACFELKYAWDIAPLRAGLAAAYLLFMVPLWPVVFLVRRRLRTSPKLTTVAVVTIAAGWVLFFTQIISW